MADGEDNREKTLPRRQTVSKAVRSTAAIPALTIVWHPDVKRIGEVARLDTLTSAGSVAINRLEPLFNRPGGQKSVSLEDRHLSRTSPALEIVANDEDDILELRPGVLEGPTEVQGRALTHSLLVSPEEIDRGLILLLAREIVLCLHRVGPSSARGPDLGMVGSGEAMERVRDAIRRAAGSDVPVLIRGETGTGKELVARAIVANSRRAGRPFVAINMGGIGSTTAVADLFGHERGAFTGAVSNRAGFFGAAHGGTLFLDEVGATPNELQPLMLRALDDGEIIPIGSDRSRKVDVRVIAATDVDLLQAMKEGRFSRPLCERLSGYQIVIPPLRARRDDFGTLLLHFLLAELTSIGESHRLDLAGPEEKAWLSAAKVARLALGSWPGNVRGLRNAVRQIVHGSKGQPRAALDGLVEELMAEEHDAAPVRQDRRGAGPKPTPARAASKAISKDDLLSALQQNRWSPSATAAALGIPRSTLNDLMEKHAEVRRVSAMSRSELRRHYDACDGNLDLMSARLMVSKRSLQLRLAANRTEDA